MLTNTYENGILNCMADGNNNFKGNSPMKYAFKESASVRYMHECMKKKIKSYGRVILHWIEWDFLFIPFIN